MCVLYRLGCVNCPWRFPSRGFFLFFVFLFLTLSLCCMLVTISVSELYFSFFFPLLRLVVCRSEQPGLVTHISITDRAGTLVDRKVGRTYLPIIVVQVHSVFRFFLVDFFFSSSSFAFHFFYLSRNSLSLHWGFHPHFLFY